MADYTGLKVDQFAELRTRLGAVGAECHVVKNTMLRIASAELGLPDEYLLATIHRPSNVDDPAQATAMVDLVAELGARIPVVLPLHPRSQGPLAALRGAPGVQVRDPLPYPHFLAALAGARLVLTDSGGVQEESSFLGIPCITVRTSTERPVTITHGTNRLSSIADTLDPANHLFGLVQFKVGTGGFALEYVGEWDYILRAGWAAAFRAYQSRRG